MPHPFQVGGTYRNRAGSYEVIAIQGDEMTIRYRDGTTIESPISAQERIWENIQIDEEAEMSGTSAAVKHSQPATSTTATRFNGFTADDFGTLEGSKWRSQKALGGVLSQHLRTQTGQPFKSWAVRRRLELHLAREDKYDFNRPLPCAKLFVYSHHNLAFGFYIETPDESDRHRFPGKFRDWDSFKTKLGNRATMQTILLEPMSNHGLTLIDYYRQESGGALGCKFQFIDGALHWWRPDSPSWSQISVDVMFQRIARLPEDEYVNLHLYTVMPKEEAINLGPAVRDPNSGGPSFTHAALPDDS